MLIKIIIPLLLLLPEVISQSTCYLDSTFIFNCSDISSVCQNHSNIIASPDTNYTCLEPLILNAYNLSISGTYSGLNLTGSLINVYNVSVASDLNIGSKSSLR